MTAPRDEGEPARRTAPPPPPYACSLRVLEPLAAFDDVRRARLLAAMAAGRTADPVLAAAAESWSGRRAAARLEPVLPDPGIEAAVLGQDGITYVCPLQTRWRAAHALESFRGQVADMAPYLAGDLDALAREVQADAAGAYRPGVSHVLSATWSAPLHWFVLVDGGERIVDLAPQHRVLLYRTPMSSARRRLARALVAVRRGIGPGPVAEALETLGRWLEEFHPRSLVELDLSGLAQVMPDEAVRDDPTAADVAEMVAALAAGRTDDLGQRYETVSQRWRAVGGLAQAN